MLNTSSNGVVPSLSDIAAVTNSGDGNGMWGNGAWWIVIIFALLFGWGNNGNWGGGYGGGNNAIPYIMNNTTDNEVSRGFDNLALSNKLDTIGANLTNGFYNQNTSLLSSFGDLNTQLCSSFDGVTAGINNLGYNLQTSLLNVSNLIDGVKYENAQNANNIIQAGNENTQRLMDMMTQNQIQDLRDRLQNAEFENSQSAQTAQIISNLLPTPRPAYTVASPYQSQNMGYYNCNCGA